MASFNPISSEGTLGEILIWILPRLKGEEVGCPKWPPDVFGICAAILAKSGAYSFVVKKWPPKAIAIRRGDWIGRIKIIGKDWRRDFKRSVPPLVEEWWNLVLSNASLSLDAVQKSDEVCEALLQLCAAADEACEAVGIPDGRQLDELDLFAERRLLTHANGASLCSEVHWSKLRVLPKQHAPQSGITIRSISHHIALCPSTDVIPRWFTAPNMIEKHSLNILLVPWPKTVVPAQFRSASPPVGELLNMEEERYGFFWYEPDPSVTGITREITKLLKRAQDTVGPIDGVILPELSLTPRQHAALRRVLMPKGCFLICGVTERATGTDMPGQNYLVVDIPVEGQSDEKGAFIEIKQCKHHRWRLDRGQIVQYGLGAQLDPTKQWWEHISLDARELNFITMKDWLTLCVLVCEDLARPDPVGDIVRAVGPNLVIALLMDGPQLGSRWPGRYATVLADDPGSSVLTLSSIGMVRLCRPPPGAQAVRTVALWKDARNRDTTQINLPEGADAIAIALTRDTVDEIVADGRGDGGITAYPVLSGICPISKA